VTVEEELAEIRKSLAWIRQTIERLLPLAEKYERKDAAKRAVFGGKR
jgi:hypothetical protein